MNALVRKDLRLLQPTLISATVLFLYLAVWVPDAFAVIEYYILCGKLPYFRGQIQVPLLWFWLASPVLSMAIAANAFAMERRDRWCDFAAMMPVSRRKNVYIKTAVALGCLAAFLLAPYLTFAAWEWLDFIPKFTQPHSGALPAPDFPYLRDSGGYVALCTGASVLLFGLGWLMSSAANSAVMAGVAAIALGGGVYNWLMGGVFASWYLPPQVARDHNLVIVVSLGVGIVTFAAGTILQLRRRTP